MAESLDRQEPNGLESTGEALADPLGEMLSDLLGAASEPSGVAEPDAGPGGMPADSPVASGDGASTMTVRAVMDDGENVVAAYPGEIPEALQRPEDATGASAGTRDVDELTYAPFTYPSEDPLPLNVGAGAAGETERAPQAIAAASAADLPGSGALDIDLPAARVDAADLEATAAATPPDESDPLLREPPSETEAADSEEPGESALDALVSTIDNETGWTDSSEFELEEEAPRKARTDLQTCIVFLLDSTRYGVPIRNVLEMDAIPRITAVPNVPAFVRGVTNLRGEIVAVLDLHSLLGLESAESPERGRILVVRTSDQQTAALAVDEVHGTAELPLADLVQPASPIQGKVSSVLLGVGDHQNQVLNVLDVDRLFRTTDLQQFTVN